MATWVAAPSTCAMLADLGANVVKIEAPEGDPYRGYVALPGEEQQPPLSPPFQMDNRGKRSLTLNLSRPQARQIARRLIDGADVFVTNMVPERLQRYGLTYAQLCRRSPRLIYANLTGYGTKGPERNRLGFDYAAFWARSGIMGMLGEPDATPPPQRPGMGDHTTSMLIVAAIALALYVRERTGRGQEVQVSLLNTALWVLGMDLQTALVAGHPPAKTSRRAVANPLWNFYRASDDHWVMLVMLQADRYWSSFCQAIERPDLENDSRFVDIKSRGKNNTDLIAILDEVFVARPRDEWGRRFNDAGLIWAPVQTVEEVLSDPQVRANKYLARFDDPTLGPVRTVATPIKFSETPSSVRGPAPEIGQHTEEVLLELGYDWEDIIRLRESGALG